MLERARRATLNKYMSFRRCWSDRHFPYSRIPYTGFPDTLTSVYGIPVIRKSRIAIGAIRIREIPYRIPVLREGRIRVTIPSAGTQKCKLASWSLRLSGASCHTNHVYASRSIMLHELLFRLRLLIRYLHACPVLDPIVSYRRRQNWPLDDCEGLRRLVRGASEDR